MWNTDNKACKAMTTLNHKIKFQKYSKAIFFPHIAFGKAYEASFYCG